MVTVAIVGTLLTQVPPGGDAVKVVVLSIHIGFGPARVEVGFGDTVPVKPKDVQPVEVSWKVNIAVPALIPVTRPELFTVATAGLLLDHVPPVVGDSVVVKPTQILFGPVNDVGGKIATVTGAVGLDTQPPVSVNVNVALPGPTAVTTPVVALTVAADGLLLVHVPPVVGDNVVVPPIHKLAPPVIATTGLFLTVTLPVGKEGQPVNVEVKMNVEVPTDRPVTKPELLTEATVGFVLAQVPPVVGDKVVVNPTHISFEPVIETTGLAVTDIVKVFVQPVAVSVKVMTEVPEDIPVTRPAVVTVATAGVALTQVPAVFGDKLVVEPIHIFKLPALTVGLGFTVKFVVVLLHNVVEFVNVNETVPDETPVTTPVAAFTVATPVLLLTHVPPVLGDKVIVLPTQITGAPNDTVGLGSTQTVSVGNDIHPVDVSVHIKVATPAIKPVTSPPLLTDATAPLLEAQVPPVAGVSVVVVKIQILSGPEIVTAGLGVTVIVNGAETQPVTPSVNVNVTDPLVIPVTSPPLVTVATPVLLLTHVPPVVGVTVVVDPIQTAGVPVTATVGPGLTVTGNVVEKHVVAELVKVNTAVPEPTAVTVPSFATVATSGFELAQVPPVVGDKVVVKPTQILLEPVMLTVGLGLTVIAIVSEQEVVEYINL